MVAGVVNEEGMRSVEEVIPESVDCPSCCVCWNGAENGAAEADESVESDLLSVGRMTLSWLSWYLSNGGGWGACWSVVSGDVCLR